MKIRSASFKKATNHEKNVILSKQPTNYAKKDNFFHAHRAADIYAHKPYLHQKVGESWQITSFSQTKERVMQLASALVDLQIAYEDKIAIISEAKSDWIIIELAALYAGAISVPLSIKLLPEEIPFRINHSDSKLLIISENTIEKVLSQWPQFDNKDLKIIVMDSPSAKISDLCKQYNFSEADLLFIDDLYKIGMESLQKTNQ
ncbi:MAG: AMP-binding protein [Flavobacteriaceae bacterium]|nr:AMP-binding protein [Flavobacteriaceae bacterium]